MKKFRFGILIAVVVLVIAAGVFNLVLANEDSYLYLPIVIGGGSAPPSPGVHILDNDTSYVDSLGLLNVVAEVQNDTADIVNLDEITDNSVRIIFQTNEESSFCLFYDQKRKNFENKIEGLDYHKIHTTDITTLVANKRYYFRIKAEKKDKQAIWSDLFTFVTASEDGVIPIKKEDIVISSNETVISSEKTDTLVLVKESPISISVSIAEAERILSISAKFRNPKVLGLNSEAKVPVGETRLVEILPGVFSGRLATPERLGQYELILEIKDRSGAFHIKK